MQATVRRKAIKMNDKRKKTAHILIKTAAILRLSITALLLLMLIHSFSVQEYDLWLVYSGAFIITKRMVVPGFLFDTILTLLWICRLDKEIFHIILYLFHAALNFYFICFVYLPYAYAFIHPYEGIGIFAVGIIAVFIWGIHFIPFFIGLIGVIKLWKNWNDAKASKYMVDKNE